MLNAMTSAKPSPRHGDSLFSVDLLTGVLLDLCGSYRTMFLRRLSLDLIAHIMAGYHHFLVRKSGNVRWQWVVRDTHHD